MITTIVRTAPRKQNTLLRTLRSIGMAFENPMLVAEPGTLLPSSYPSRVNSTKLGGFKNFDNCVSIGLQSKCDYILICEDDIIVRSDAQAKVTELLKDCDLSKFGVASLYLSKKNAKEIKLRNGWLRHNIGWDWWGAQALLFSRESAEAMRSEEYYKWHFDNYEKNQQTDACVMRSMTNLELDKWVHCPSLVEHIGRVSTLGHGAISQRGNVGYNFKQI